MPKKLVIAIDCDDVLIKTSEYTVGEYNKKYGTKVQLKNAHKSHNEEWQADREETFRRISTIQHCVQYGNIEPEPDAIRVVAELSKRHELHVVTARPEDVMEVTHRMLDRYFPGCFKTVNHIGPDKSKGEVCDLLRADVIIDDNIRHLMNARDCSVTWRIWFGQYPFQGEDIEDAHTSRAYNWGDVETEIERIANT